MEYTNYTCDECGIDEYAEVPEGEPVFCEECGSQMRYELKTIRECQHDWEADIEGYVFCKECGEPHPNNVPEWNTDSLQNSRPDLFNANGTRKVDY